tara:strand:+ start:51 stop:833 length:783 start_codon:yes stop_codon:yes gene_type:complete
MHVPGHNPYITQLETPYTFAYGGPGTTSDDTFNMTGYQYQGMNETIMDTLAGIFGGYSGTQFDLDSYLPDFDFETFGGSNSDDVEIQFRDDGVVLAMSPDDKAGMTTHWGTPMEGHDTYFTPSGGYDFSMGVLPFVDVFDREALARGLSAIAGTDDAISAGEVVALDPSKIEQTESAYYDPFESIKREELTDQYVQNVGGVSTGGFAGSGARRSGLSTAERMYDAGYGGLLAEIEKMRGAATQDILDTMFSWQELVSDVT